MGVLLLGTKDYLGNLGVQDTILLLAVVALTLGWVEVCHHRLRHKLPGVGGHVLLNSYNVVRSDCKGLTWCLSFGCLFQRRFL